MDVGIIAESICNNMFANYTILAVPMFILMANLMNAAASLGVGTCWINRATEYFDLPEGKAWLKRWNLPETMRGVAFCIMGYPDGPAPAPKERREGRVLRV